MTTPASFLSSIQPVKIAFSIWTKLQFMQAKSISIDTGVFCPHRYPKDVESIWSLQNWNPRPNLLNFYLLLTTTQTKKNIYIYRNFYKLVRWNLLKTQDYLDYKRHTTQHKNQTQYSEDPKKRTPRRKICIIASCKDCSSFYTLSFYTILLLKKSLNLPFTTFQAYVIIIKKKHSKWNKNQKCGDHPTV